MYTDELTARSCLRAKIDEELRMLFSEPVGMPFFHSSFVNRNSSLPLSGAFAENDDGKSAQQDLKIQKKRPVIDVMEIQFHPLVEIDLIAA